jgi:hypothetical protein
MAARDYPGRPPLQIPIPSSLIIEAYLMTNPDPDLARFLSSLSVWLDGMGKFIAISKGEWRNAYSGQHLLAQDLRKQTLRLKKQVMTLSQRYGSQDASRNSDVASGKVCGQNVATVPE